MIFGYNVGSDICMSQLDCVYMLWYNSCLEILVLDSIGFK